MMHGGGIMKGLSDSRGIVHWFVGTLMAAATTLLLVWSGANSTTAGMVFLVLVVWSATQAGIWLALYIAVLCALSFDYFFLLPYHTFRLAGGQQWVDMLSFAASCVVVERVAERARRQTRQAEEAARRRGAALRAEPGDDAARGRRRADPRLAPADQPHLCPGRGGFVRSRSGPVLRLDRRVADEHPRQHDRHDPGAESDAGNSGRLYGEDADAGIAAGGSSGLAAGDCFRTR